jgi:hypothetical protein
LQSFETELLAEDAKFAGLASLSRSFIAKGEALDSGEARREGETNLDGRGELMGRCSNKYFEMGKISVFCLGGALPGTPAALALERMQERWRTEAIGVNWSATGKAKWKFRLNCRI